MASGAIPVQDQSPDRRFSSLLIASSQSLSGPVRYCHCLVSGPVTNHLMLMAVEVPSNDSPR